MSIQNGKKFEGGNPIIEQVRFKKLITTEVLNIFLELNIPQYNLSQLNQDNSIHCLFHFPKSCSEISIGDHNTLLEIELLQWVILLLGDKVHSLNDIQEKINLDLVVFRNELLDLNQGKVSKLRFYSVLNAYFRTIQSEIISLCDDSSPRKPTPILRDYWTSEIYRNYLPLVASFAGYKNISEDVVQKINGNNSIKSIIKTQLKTFLKIQNQIM